MVSHLPSARAVAKSLGKRKLAVAVIIALSIGLFLAQTASPSQRGQEPVDTRRAVTFSTLVPENTVDATVWIHLSDSSGLFKDIQNKIVLDIAANVGNDTRAPSITVIYPPWYAISSVNSPGMNYSLGYLEVGLPMGIVTIFLPENSIDVTAKIEWFESSTVVLWRSSVGIPTLNVYSNFGPAFTRYLVDTPENAQIRKVVLMVSPKEGATVPNVRHEKVSYDGKEYIALDIPSGYSAGLLYDSVNRDLYSITLIFTIFALIGSSKYILKLNVLGRARNTYNLAKVWYGKIVKHIDSNKLLSLYILCALLMVSLSLSVGPDPRAKVFVLASPEISEEVKQIVNEAGGVALTVEDTSTELENLSNVGVINAFVIADFIPTTGYAERYVHPALKNVKEIIIVRSHASAFAEEVKQRYSGGATRITEVGALSDLGWTIERLPRRQNFLGLDVTPSAFVLIAAMVGALSFVIVFFGLAFFASRMVEVGKKPGYDAALQAIAYAVFYFVFTEAVYIVSSVLLAVPLGLHAVTSGSRDVTAIGLLGFGGGSRPRMVAGFLGFLFGALIAQKGGARISRYGLLTFLVLISIIFLSPLSMGLIFHEMILFYTVGPHYEAAFEASFFARSFLGMVGSAFGAWVSPTYAISRGIILYYLGAIPFFLFSKLKRITATVLLFVSALLASQGGIRVAEMTPWKAFTDVMPGIAVGLIVACLFILISRGEELFARLFHQ